MKTEPISVIPKGWKLIDTSSSRPFGGRAEYHFLRNKFKICFSALDK